MKKNEGGSSSSIGVNKDRGKQNLLSGTFIGRERITIWSWTGDEYAARHSKWSLLVVMWAGGIQLYPIAGLNNKARVFVHFLFISTPLKCLL